MNYKIKLTEENRAAIKDIANRNGMNKIKYSFDEEYIGGYYEIINGSFEYYRRLRDSSPCEEINFDQFKQMFDKQETPPNGVPFDEEKTKGTADIHIGNETVVGNIFKNRKWQPKRGDRVLVWDDNEEVAKERIFLGYIKGAKCPIQVVSPIDDSRFLTDRPFDVIEYANMKPLPAEEPQPEESDFKSKVIELVRRAICNAEQSKNIELEEKGYSQALAWQIKYEALSDILTQIKELN